MRAARPESQRLLTLATIVAVVAVLALARDLLIPIAFAIVLAFVLTPPVSRLERFGLGRAAAVVVTVGTSLLAAGLVGWIVAVQAIDLVTELPRQRPVIRAKLAELEGRTGGWLDRAREGMSVIREELLERGGVEPDALGARPGPSPTGDLAVAAAPGAADRASNSPASAPAEPVRGGTESLELHGMIDWALDAAIAAGIAGIFAVFILLKREDLRDRAIAMAGAERLNLTTRVVDDAADRVSRFLLAQLLVNIAFGAAIAIGLWLIGVPNAILFGALVVPLRFVPAIGLWIAAGIPIAVAALLLEGWTAPLLTAALFAAVELVIVSAIEPWAFGSRTGIPVVTVVLAMVFWTWLWGAPGLVLAMPLTVCLASVARQLPADRWLRVLLDERPSLSDAARVYQRLLALDAEEALAIARAAVGRLGLSAVFDDVLLPALAMLERDRHAGAIVEATERFVLEGLDDIVEALAEDSSAGAKAVAAAPAPQLAAAQHVQGVACLPARDRADEIAATMLAHLLRRRGIDVSVITSSGLFSERIAAAQRAGAARICISAVPPLAESHARIACRRLRAEAGIPSSTRVIVGLWGAAPEPERRERLAAAGADAVMVRLDEAVRGVAGAGALE
ncbi:MAG TPA: AI-2E family transporter [Phycisphaerales bacterium]|nr:AI-2E family transporter [Phycisphaerales bacterium]HMP37371.1 AI-2E family transporter [Phycisphaerales bacterium]